MCKIVSNNQCSMTKNQHKQNRMFTFTNYVLEYISKQPKRDKFLLK